MSKQTIWRDEWIVCFHPWKQYGISSAFVSKKWSYSSKIQRSYTSADHILPVEWSFTFRNLIVYFQSRLYTLRLTQSFQSQKIGFNALFVSKSIFFKRVFKHMFPIITFQIWRYCFQSPLFVSNILKLYLIHVFHLKRCFQYTWSRPKSLSSIFKYPVDYASRMV